MKARPILFNSAMINALLDGRKTQTRRVVKPQPEFRQVYVHKGRLVYDGSQRVWCWNGKSHGRYPDEYLPSMAAMCPYGQPGDLLWCRETWVPFGDHALYKADGDPDFNNGKGLLAIDRWHPSIHMPRWASRLTLRIKSVRVERLREITAADCLSEGLKTWRHEDDFAYGYDGCAVCGYATPTGAFHALWDSINAARGYGWKANPWVWVIEFEVIHKNVDEVLRETNTTNLAASTGTTGD